MARKILCMFFLISISATLLLSQDKGVFEGNKPGFYNEIRQSIKDYYEKERPERKSFKLDLEGKNLPESVDEFNYQWHTSPVSQGNTGTCWSFSTTSFFESEAKRLNDVEVKLSQIHTVYWEYVEKAREFVKTRGESRFSEGSEANAVTRIWKKYGVVPRSVYAGKPDDMEYHSHAKMFREMYTYLQNVKETSSWNKDEVIKTIKSIMNDHIGEPPANFSYKGNNYTPKSFLSDYLKINPDDYVDILSYKQQPYYQQVEYEVPDNWWHNKDYYNVPLVDFMNILNYAIENGYTMSIGGDVSEPGRNSEKEVFVIPSFDIPSEFINEDARQFRFSNKTTTDDHGIHLIGNKTDENGEKWYLIKDSGSGSFDGPNKGYFFMHEDYVKLKIMDFMVHKDAAKDILAKFNK